jgi:hypothetical protein
MNKMGQVGVAKNTGHSESTANIGQNGGKENMYQNECWTTWDRDGKGTNGDNVGLMTDWDRIRGENHRRRCEKRRHEIGLAQGQLDYGLGLGHVRQDGTRDNKK